MKKIIILTILNLLMGCERFNPPQLTDEKVIQEKRIAHTQVSFNFKNEVIIITEKNESGDIINIWESKCDKVYPTESSVKLPFKLNP